MVVTQDSTKNPAAAPSAPRLGAVAFASLQPPAPYADGWAVYPDCAGIAAYTLHIAPRL